MKLSHHMLCLYLSHPFSLQYLHLGLPTLKGKRAVFADSVTVNGHKANFSVVLLLSLYNKTDRTLFEN